MARFFTVKGFKDSIANMFGSEDYAGEKYDSDKRPSCPSPQEMHSKSDDHDTINSLGTPTWLLTDNSITEHPSYHARLSAGEAQNKLKCHEGNCYLVWINKRSKLILTVMRRKKVVNFPICISTNDEIRMYEIAGTDNKFDDVFKMLDYYKHRPVNEEIDGIGSAVSVGSFQKEDTDHSNNTVVPSEQNQMNDDDLVRRRNTLQKMPRRSRDDIAVDYYSEDRNIDNSWKVILCRRVSTDDTEIEYYPRVWRDRENVENSKAKRYSALLLQKNTRWRNLNIEEYPSYHGTMIETEAEKILMQHDITCYLIRYCKNWSTYILSVQCRGRVHHFGIEISGRENCTYSINGTKKKFKSSVQMLEFYQKHPLSDNVSSIGEPVVQILHKSSFESSLRMRSRSTNVALPLKMKYLHRFNWKDEDGLTHTFKLVQHISTKWRNIGIQIDLSVNTLNDYEQRYDRDATRCWEVVMQAWLDGQGRDEYPVTWEGLCELTKAVQCDQIAENLLTAVYNACFSKN